MGKEGFEKSIFNIDRIDINIPYIFIFEGPIDAMFVKNGVSVAGLTLSDTQLTQLSEFPFHKKIWILDNPKIDESAMKKTQELLLNKESVYFWPFDNKNKDLNEWCVNEKKDEIDYNIIINNLYPNI